jgi:hypothetical protein
VGGVKERPKADRAATRSVLDTDRQRWLAVPAGAAGTDTTLFQYAGGGGRLLEGRLSGLGLVSVEGWAGASRLT